MPASVNQGLAGVDLLHHVGADLTLTLKRARVPQPGALKALYVRGTFSWFAGTEPIAA